ncbi:MAG: FecR family protein [Gallionella sp.]|nr:FecR family protein [Gallionella sp.]
MINYLTRHLSTLRSRLLPFFLLASALMSAPAQASEEAGTILSFTGKVEILRGLEKRPPGNHGVLYSGESIVTGNGQAQIRFADGTLLTLYRDTQFAIDDYHYGKDKSDRAQFSLVNGVMHTLTGKIDKKNYLLKTRFANLGVRGTEYSMQLDEALHVSVDQGQVQLANAAGSVLVGAGQSILITGANSMPAPVVTGRAGPGGGQGGPGRGHGGGGHGGPGGGAASSGGAAGGTAGAPPPPGTGKF